MNKSSTPLGFEPELLEELRTIFEEKIVFNKVLGLRLVTIEPNQVSARLLMRPELVGHFGYNRIHGGVISAALDALGGIAVMAALCAKHGDEPIAKRLERFLKIGTLDLRVDYLRPGIGHAFEARCQVLKLGSRVGNTRMEFLGSDGQLLSTGCGAYIVS